jgi:two-component system, NarL family, sensor kinase
VARANGAVERQADASPSRRGLSPVWGFAASGLAVLVLLGLGAALLVGKQSEQEALRIAQERTRVIGHGMIEPLLTNSLIAGDTAAIPKIDRVVRTRVLGHAVVRVKIWSREGQILYSDEPRLIGARYSLGAEELRTLGNGRTEADVSDLSKPENRFERHLGTLDEVYMALHTPQGHPVLFETYVQGRSIAGDQRRLLFQFLPVLLAALVLLWLTQLPLARRMGQRLRQGQKEREKLLRRAIESSDRERRRVAHDLHDGVIQDLAGLSFELSAAADVAAGSESSDLTHKLVSASAAIRRSIRGLRSLLVDMYPPDLHTMGLCSVLEDLASSVEARGIAVELDMPGEIDLPIETEGLVFRVAQESVRNAVTHSGATSMKIELIRTNGGVHLTLRDNGRGFSEVEIERRRAEGHMGLRMLDEFVSDSGGELTLDSKPGVGTTVSARIPVP